MSNEIQIVGDCKDEDGEYTQCECCRIEGLEVKIYRRTGRSVGEVEQTLCNLCACTLASNVIEYLNHTNADVIRLTAQFTNIILARIDRLEKKIGLKPMKIFERREKCQFRSGDKCRHTHNQEIAGSETFLGDCLIHRCPERNENREKPDH